MLKAITLSQIYVLDQTEALEFYVGKLGLEVRNDIDDVIAGLRAHGAELVGEVAQYRDSYRFCYIRGPEGIVVALAEELS